MRWAPWILCVVLALTALVQLRTLSRPGSGFATLPILVPVSLEHEAAARAEGQAQVQAPLDTAAIEELLAALEAAPPDPALAPRVQAFAQARADLLALRDRRHQLNVRLMHLGMQVAAVLGPEQWQAVVDHRDAARAEADAALLDRVLERLQ